MLHFRNERGASLVEMAFVMPLVLLVIFGIVDFGRYVSHIQAVETASREGARYASTTGGSVPHFIDCDGIREATRGTSVINPADSEVDVTYEGDSGPLSIGCQGGLDTPVIDVISNTTRVQVTVRTEFHAITPMLGEFIGAVTIVATDERTIVRSRL